MMPDLATIEKQCFVSDAERELLQSIARPIVLLCLRPESNIVEKVAPGQNFIGVMLPYTPLHYLLLEKADGFPQALVMTSGNVSEEPIATDNDDARQRLTSLADAFLMHNRDIYIRCDDSGWCASLKSKSIPSAAHADTHHFPSNCRGKFRHCWQLALN